MADASQAGRSASARNFVLDHVATALSLSSAARDRVAAGVAIQVFPGRLRCDSDWTAFELITGSDEESPPEFIGTAVAMLVDELKECAGRERAESVDAYLLAHPWSV